MTTAEKIKQLRLSICLNRQEFAKALGLTLSSVAYYEKGTREPSFLTMRKMIALAKKKGIKLKVEDIRGNL